MLSSLERKVLININSVQKLMRKALLYRLITNIEKITSKAGLSHQKISAETGRRGNWFNDAFNNNEDIKISSLAKILSVVNHKTDIKEYHLSDVFDEKVLKISRVISSLSDESSNSIQDFILSEETLLLDLIGDWGSLNSKKKLSSEEISCFEELQQLLRAN